MSRFSRDILGALREMSRQISPNGVVYRRTAELYGKGWVDPPSLAKRRQPDALAMLMRDPVIAKAITLRMHMVAGTNHYFIARDEHSKPIVSYFSDLFDLVPGLQNAKLNLTRAIFEGVSWLRVLSPNHDTRYRIGDDKEARLWWYPGQLLHLDSDHVRLDYDDDPYETATPEGDSFRKRHYYWSWRDDARNKWFKVSNSLIAPEFIQCVYHDSQSSNGYGEGLLDQLWVYFRAKAKCMESLLKGVSRFGWPIIVAKMSAGDMVGGSSVLGGNYQAPDSRAQRIVDALDRVDDAHRVVTIDEKESIDVIGVDGGAVQRLLEVIAYCDKVCVELILGSSMPTGGGEAGSFARAAVEAASSSTLIKHDRQIMDEALGQLVRTMWMLNRTSGYSGFLDAVTADGRMLMGMQPPKIATGREEVDDPARKLEIIQGVMSMGVPVRAEDVYSAAGLEQPGPQDELAGAQQPPAAGQVFSEAGVVPAVARGATRGGDTLQRYFDAHKGVLRA